MPIGKLSEADRQRLYRHFWPIVEQVCLQNDCWAGEVLNRGFKSKNIARARAEIVRELRETAFTYYVGNGYCRLVLNFDEADDSFERLEEIPFKLLGRMLGLDHSTLVYGQARLKEQEKADGKATT